jgi:hypothetical protein
MWRGLSRERKSAADGTRRFSDLHQWLVSSTGFEPVTSSVSGHARPFARSLAALHATTSALLKRVIEPGTQCDVRPRMGSLLTTC